MSNEAFVDDFSQRAIEALEAAGATSDEQALQVLVAEFHKAVPWATQVPQIIDTARADMGVGIAIYYKHPEEGLLFLMLEPNGPNEGKLQIGGGFMGLSTEVVERDPETGKVTKVGDDEPEQQRDALVREVTREELVGKNGPLFVFDKDRPFKIDQKNISVRGVPRSVNGYALKLTGGEFLALRNVLETPEGVIHSHNDEIKAARFVPAAEIFADPEILAHQDQLTLLERVAEFDSLETAEERLEFLMKGFE